MYHGNILLSLTLKETFLLYKYTKNTYTKGRALMKMYRIVPRT